MRFGAVLLCCLGFHLASASVVRAQFEELVRRVPSTANAIVIIDADKIFSSPAAQRLGWKENRQKAWESGLSMLPPTAKLAVLGSHLDLDTTAPMWEVAVMKLDRDPSLPKFLELSGGTADKIGEYDAVQMPGDAFVVNFGHRVVGAMSPGNRQQIGRWVRETDAHKGMSLSPYLSEAYGFANDLGTPIILALDLEDVTTPDEVLEGLESAKEVVGISGVDLQALAKSLSTIRGVTLGITLRDKPFGKLKVDFASEIPLPGEAAKKLLLHALARRGAMLDELEEWKVDTSGKQVTLEGYLTPSGMTRLSSLFHRPPAIPHADIETKPADQQSPGDQESMRVRTKQYWTDMSKLLDDLAGKPSSSGAKTMGQVGVWCERYAAKIEKLPTLNVDPMLLDFSAQTCSSLRLIHSTIHAGAARGEQRARAVSPQYNYYGYGETYGFSYRWGQLGSWGTVAVPDMRQYYNDKSRAKYEENSKATFDVRQTGQQIRASVADMRRKLTDKYKTQF